MKTAGIALVVVVVALWSLFISFAMLPQMTDVVEIASYYRELKLRWWAVPAVMTIMLSHIYVAFLAFTKLNARFGNKE